MKQNRSRKKNRYSGFTLVEVIFAGSLAVLVGGFMMQMFISVSRINFDSTAKLAINSDIRSFTNELTQNARSAIDFKLYQSINNLTERGSGTAGDFLVLVWADPIPLDEASNGDELEFYYRRVVGFARIVDDETENTGPVVKFEMSYPDRDSPDAVFSGDTNIIDEARRLIANNSDSSVEEVVELSRGLATEQLFFYSRTGESITVNGEIYHGNDARRVTNTYNFTVTPRG